MLGPMPSRCVFQQDNARPHTAKITQDWLASRHFQLMKWPAKSPDLSWIDNIWAWMADTLDRRTYLAKANFEAVSARKLGFHTPVRHGFPVELYP